jgi:hypothetical protein
VEVEEAEEEEVVAVGDDEEEDVGEGGDSDHKLGIWTSFEGTPGEGDKVSEIVFVVEDSEGSEVDLEVTGVVVEIVF